MGKYVTPFSFKRDIFGQVEGPKYTVDKIMSYVFYHVNAPSVDFIMKLAKHMKIVLNAAKI